jgi:hypothetical protein
MAQSEVGFTTETCTLLLKLSRPEGFVRRARQKSYHQ